MKEINGREILVWIGILAASAVLAYSMSGGGNHNHANLKGQPIGDLKLRDADGKVLDLSQKKGRTVVLNVYATWCPPCRAEIPDFALFHKDAQAADAPIEVYGVVFESGEPAEATKESRKLGVSYPILLGNQTMAQTFGLHIYPTTIVVNPEGIITHQFEGQVDYNWLRDAAGAPNKS